MKLIGSLTSPYVRKVRIVLAEKKIEYEFAIDNPWDPATHVGERNPLGKIPVLVLDDDTPLFDSRVIVEYLDNVAPNNRLIPATGRERILVKRWEALGDGLCDAAAAIVMESRRPLGERSASWIERQQEKLVRTVESVAGELGDQTWCHGNAMTLADISVGVALGYLSFRMAELDWRGAHPNLARLHDKLMQRPAFAETVPQG